jgi:nicotinate-nucleotide pyrophosphorylase (carboxylating)
MDPAIIRLIESALQEDIGTGDVTSAYFIPAESRGRARVVAREPGVVSGIEVATQTCASFDPGLRVQVHLSDGDAFQPGDCLLELEGATRSILSVERTLLNFLQRLCGIATLARRHVEAAKPHPVQIWDTRKTTPGWRLLEKQAVRAGGGVNHRLGLHDAVMVKDNHLAANGSLEALQSAIDRVRADHPGMKIQIEADTLDQLAGFLTLTGVDMILLDNMDPATLRRAVELNAGRLWLEASGGITLDTLPAYAATGVNAISIGALTHSARALDLGLDFV